MSSPPAPAWPSVSVVVPTHDRPELLRRTVRSIVAQRYPGHVECLLVFDREEPRKPNVDVPPTRRIELLTNSRTPGPAGAMNTGMVAAREELIAFCNDDDEWLPDKLRLQVEAMERTGAALGICGIYLTSGRSFGRRFARIPKKSLLHLDDLLRAARHEVHTSTFIVRRDSLDEIGLIDEEIPGSYGEDYDWLVRAARITPIVAVRRPLTLVRWEHSYFREGWHTMVEALRFQLERRPELHQDRKNLARIYGRLAFAHGALGQMDQARAYSRRSLALDRWQARGYLALLVSYRLLSPRIVLRTLHFLGRGF